MEIQEKLNQFFDEIEKINRNHDLSADKSQNTITTTEVNREIYQRSSHISSGASLINTNCFFSSHCVFEPSVLNASKNTTANHGGEQNSSSIQSLKTMASSAEITSSFISNQKKKHGSSDHQLLQIENILS